MSQAKVDRYKIEKANRKETMAKQKTKQKMRKAMWGAAALVFAGWIGFSAFDLVVSSIPREIVEVDYSAMESYLQTMY